MQVQILTWRVKMEKLHYTTCAWPVSEAQWRNNRKDVEELLIEAIDARGT